MGNRVGLTQLDADQLADLYRAESHASMWSDNVFLCIKIRSEGSEAPIGSTSRPR